MKSMRDYMIFFINMFTRVTTVVVFASALYIRIFWGANVDLKLSLMWQILGVSAICAFGVMLLVIWEQKFTKAHSLWKNLLQVVYVSAVVMGCGFAFKWFNISSLSMVLGMESCIIVVYSLVIWISYFLDWQAAKAMNQKLAQRAENEGAGSGKMKTESRQ